MLSFRTIARRASLLALAASLLASVLGPPFSGGAAVAAGSANAAARLQVVIKEVHIGDDHDPGDGELRLFTGIWHCKQGIAPPCFNEEFDPAYWPRGPEMVTGWMDSGSLNGTAERIARAKFSFSAGTGETYTFDDRPRVFPQDGDEIWDLDTSTQLGFPVEAGQQYVLQFQMYENDFDSAISGDDFMGYAFLFIDTYEHGLRLGTHTGRATASDGGPGDFAVTYEIRRALLPDLRPGGITVKDLPGRAEKRVCMSVVNAEVGGAPPFEVALRVNGFQVDGGRTAVGILPSGGDAKGCVEIVLPALDPLELTAVVDPSRLVAEYNETNNESEFACTLPSQAGCAPAQQESTGTTATAPGAAQVDLTVSAVKVNGQVPDGKDDCKDGKNSVTVIVKNAGTVHAASFAVRLDVDGQQQDEALLSGLVAGQEQEVRFEDVRLKKGTHALTVVADQNKALAESNDDNNALKVTAQCKGPS